MEFGILYYLLFPIAIILILIQIVITYKKCYYNKNVFFNVLFITLLLGIVITLVIPLLPQDIANSYIRHWKRPDDLVNIGSDGNTTMNRFPIEYRNILFLNELVYSMIINATRAFIAGIIPCTLIVYLRKRARINP
jgi:hypothetical protein